MGKWFRRFSVAALVLLACYFGLLGLLVAAFGSDPYAGASVVPLRAVVSALPYGPGNDEGECNEVLVSDTLTQKYGYSIQLACQGVAPAGQLGFGWITPALPETGYYYEYHGTVSQNTLTGPAWGNYVANTPAGHKIFSSGNCDANTGQSSFAAGQPSPWLYIDASWDDGPSAGDPGSYSCSGFSGSGPVGTAGGTSWWAEQGHVVSVYAGPSEPCGSGGTHSCSSFQVFEDWSVNAAPDGEYSPSSGVYDSWDMTAPAPVLGSGWLNGSKCPAASSFAGGLSGVQLPWQMGLDSGDGYSGYPSWFANSGMALDSVTCAKGNQFVQFAQLPGNYYTGGSPTQQQYGGGAAPCTLNGVTPAPTNETAGENYATLFDYSGPADEIAVDPADELVSSGSETTFPSSGGSNSIELDADASVVAASGSPQEVPFTPTKTGDWSATYWCASQGYVYQWGTATGGQSEGGGSGGEICGVTCVTTGTGQTTLDECFASAGWDLYNPVTWVLGSLHDGLCILEWLFEPSSSSLAGFVNLFSVSSSGTSSATVGQWLGAVTSLGADAPVAAVADIQTASEGGCSLPSLSAAGHSLSTCSALSAAGGTGGWSVIDSIVAAVFGVLCALGVYRLIQRALASG